MKRRLLVVAASLAVAWLAWGLWLRAGRAPRPPPPPGEVRGAYHLHTTHSDGRGSLPEVVRAASEAGLQFLVVTDHNVMSPEDQGYRDGVLVVQGSEVSAPYGHIVALGIPRELSKEERQRDTIGTIRALGGQAVLAHPFHPRRPFTRWKNEGWTGFEVLSNDSFWGLTLRRHQYWRIAEALLALPWDPARSMLAFYHRPAEELRRYDEVAAQRPVPLLCASDAHGYPSYLAAFAAFSMHLPLTLTGEAPADARAVVAGLLDGRGFCVLDGLAPASGVRLQLAPAGDRIEVQLSTPDPSRARWLLFRDGALAGEMAVGRGGAGFSCGGLCARGAWRAEGRWDGHDWVFTNPIRIE
ncbi:MAG TPA: PHP domain-containing protein [Anaeromyxobacteraceae bacterium]|nr:PHP domain-containing protein [Anaeromyxobacteraceae bacterium]